MEIISTSSTRHRGDATSKPLRADARRNRDAIVAAARTAFAHGDDGIRFDDFAGRAGVGAGTLYRHFPTRESLAAAVYREEADALCRLARDASADVAPGEALGRFLRGYVAYLDEHRALTRALIAASGSTALMEGAGDLEAAVLGLLARETAAGGIRADVDPGAVLVAMHGIGATQDRPRWRQEADGVVTALLAGLRVGR
ncbi:MAG: TetR/AcrR family transcriptional regulator [Cellulomonas sp.]|nr:TetR/AcrR family transcriptional regulator [Cellulomonas sp.]